MAFSTLIANRRFNPRQSVKSNPVTMIESGSSEEMEMEGGHPTSTHGGQAQWPTDMDLEEWRVWLPKSGSGQVLPHLGKI
jgi:hypothetical protein